MFDWPGFDPQLMNAGAQLQVQIEANAVPQLDDGGLPSAPRLFMDQTRLDQMRAAILVDGSHHQTVFNAIRERVDQNDWRVYDENPNDGNWNYARSWLAREAALLYQVTGQSQYAQIAYDALASIYDDPDPDNRKPNSGNALARGMTGMGYAVAYDWAAQGWSETQRNTIRDRLVGALNAWPNYSYPSLNSPYASNWVPVARGAELVMMLAVGEETTRSDRYGQLKYWLGEHLEIAYGPTGWSQEGNGYLAYGGGFLFPAIYALQDVGDTSLDATLDAIDFWKLPLYAGTFAEDQAALQFGVGWEGFDNEGWTSLLLNSVDGSELDYYQYFYDRHRGILNTAPDQQKFDNRRAGSTWALIYYPTDNSGVNPGESLGPSLADQEKGAFYFRNRWQDENDVMVSIMGDFERHIRSWDQEEAFALGLHAYDTRFIGGPDKQRDSQYYSALMVNGQVGGDEKTVGAPGVFEASDNGGYAIVDGGQVYETLGLDSAQRHLFVDFSGDAGSVVLSTLDQIRDGDFNDYAWQLNLDTTAGDGGIVASSGMEDGLPTFLLRGNNDSYVKGWILHPSDAAVLAGDPLQVLTSGTDADIWTVMVVGSGTAPAGEVTGTGLNAVLTVGNAQISYDAANNRIIQTVAANAIATLAGDDSDNTLTGNAGRNTLIGGRGADVLTGMSGFDNFVYNASDEGGDTITDLGVDDQILISAAGFGHGLVAGVALSDGAIAATGVLVQGNTPIGTSANFLYENGVLSFDPDGTGGQPQVAIATLTGAPALSVQQIQIF